MAIINGSGHSSDSTGEGPTPPTQQGRTPTAEEAVAAMEYMNARIQHLERERNIPTQRDINNFFDPASRRGNPNTAAGYLQGTGNGSFGDAEGPLPTNHLASLPGQMQQQLLAAALQQALPQQAGMVGSSSGVEVAPGTQQPPELRPRRFANSRPVEVFNLDEDAVPPGNRGPTQIPQRVTAASRVVDLTTENAVDQGDGTVVIPAGDLERLMEQARTGRTTGTTRPFPPAPSRSGNRYYTLFDECTKTGKSMVCGGHVVAAQHFATGTTWDTWVGTGVIKGCRDLEEAIAHHKRQYPRRTVVELRI